MMSSSDPVRLAEKLGKRSTLGCALKAARASGPTDQQLEALQRNAFGSIAATAVGTGAALARNTPATPATPATTGTTVSSAISTKLILLLASAVAVGGSATILGMRSRSLESSPRSSPPASERRAPDIAADGGRPRRPGYRTCTDTENEGRQAHAAAHRQQHRSSRLGRGNSAASACPPRPDRQSRAGARVGNPTHSTVSYKLSRSRTRSHRYPGLGRAWSEDRGSPRSGAICPATSSIGLYWAHSDCRGPVT